MSKLFKLENITEVKDVSGRGKLFDTIDIQVRSLKNLGYEPDRYGPLLIPIITSRIPDDLNLIIRRRLDSADRWDIEIVLNVLKTEITAREKTVLVSEQTLLSHQEKSPILWFFLAKSHTKAKIVVLSLTYGQEKYCANKQTLFCVFKRFSSRERIFFEN